MKIRSYVGAEGETVIINSAQDLYPVLDWFYNRLIEVGGSDEELRYVAKLMEKVKKDGYGSEEDVDNIDY